MGALRSRPSAPPQVPLCSPPSSLRRSRSPTGRSRAGSRACLGLNGRWPRSGAACRCRSLAAASRASTGLHGRSSRRSSDGPPPPSRSSARRGSTAPTSTSPPATTLRTGSSSRADGYRARARRAAVRSSSWQAAGRCPARSCESASARSPRGRRSATWSEARRRAPSSPGQSAGTVRPHRPSCSPRAWRRPRRFRSSTTTTGAIAGSSRCGRTTFIRGASTTRSEG